MKKIAIVIAVIVLQLSCNNQKDNANKNTENATSKNEKATSNLVANTGKTFLKANIQNKAFVATNEVLAIYNEFGKYYTIMAQNDEFTISIDIPQNKSIGSFTCEGRVIENSTKKGFNADAAAVTIEEKTDNYISGSFTMLAADTDGNIQSVKDGKFKALINKN